jgi:hypothetical protein
MLVLGYARKMRWSTRTKYSGKQIGFLKWAFSLGQTNINRKLTAEKAAEVMKLVGTTKGAKRFPEEAYMKCSADGKPAFFRSELIEKYEIKSFFSRTKAEIMKQLGSK